MESIPVCTDGRADKLAQKAGGLCYLAAGPYKLTRTPSKVNIYLFIIGRKFLSVRHFCRASTIRKRDLAIRGVSVRLFVCPSHSRNVSKLITVGSRGFHAPPVAHGIFHTNFEGFIRDWGGQNRRKTQLSPNNCCLGND